MKGGYLHNYIFRLFLGISGGSLAYILILLSSNNLSQLSSYFFSSELYLCCFIAFLLFEWLRFLHVRAEKDQTSFSFKKHLLRSCLKTLVVTIFLSSFVCYFYYIKVEGFPPSYNELALFCIIFSFLGLLYSLVYLSSLYLQVISSEKVKQEEVLQSQLEDDFKEYKRGVNPELLFESLEAVLDKIDEDSRGAEKVIEHLAVLYRYILTLKEKQVVDFADEESMLKELEQLLNLLPYRKIELVISDYITAKIIPGCMLLIVQEIVRDSIRSSSNKLNMRIRQEADTLIVSTNRAEKLNKKSSKTSLQSVKNSYKILTDHPIVEVQDGEVYSIIIPILRTQNALV